MSKIVTAINVMISNPDLITGVIKGAYETECFFLYDKKHPWSVLKIEDDEIYLSYYPKNKDIASLAKIPGERWGNLNISTISYNSKELGTKEAKASMMELFSIVNGKVWGIDDVLDEIIESDKNF